MSHNFLIPNTDTDSISFCKSDMLPFPQEEITFLTKELNDISPEFMVWEPDGHFRMVLVLKAKNYILQDFSGKVTIKGSGIRDQKKPKKYRALCEEIVHTILEEKNNFLEIYNKYVVEAWNISDIAPWCSKHTISSTTLESTRANETKVIDAIEGTEYVEGDRVYLFFKEDETRCLLERFDGNYDKIHLLKSLWKTTEIFANILPEETFPKYHLVGNQPALYNLLGIPIPEKPKRQKKIVEEIVETL